MRILTLATLDARAYGDIVLKTIFDVLAKLIHMFW